MVRKGLDVLMVILMIIVMSYQAVGNLFHEVAGVALLVLFLVHNILNRKWYQNIAGGKYSVFRKTMLAVDILTLISMLAAMGTGIYLSQSIFAPFLGMREGYLIRPWHVAAGAWGTILVSVHGGMHIRIPKERKPAFIVCGILLSGIGIWAFLTLDMPNRLLFRDMGEYWRYSGILLFAANAAVMAFFAVVSAVVTAKVKNLAGIKEIRKDGIMKKLTAMFLCAVTAFSLAACGSRNQEQETQAQTETQTEAQSESSEEVNENSEDSQITTVEASGNSNILIAYFGVPETDGTDTEAGASRVAVDGEVLGNNEYIAQIIRQETGGDLFAIETVQEYPGTHDELLEFAYEELQENARPELATQIENLDSYDTIFLGFPNWNADLPMPLYTFLEEYDFSGKTIIPFTTHGGSGFSSIIRTIESLQPGATVMEDGLSVSRNSVAGAQNDVIDWVTGLNL